MIALAHTSAILLNHSDGTVRIVNYDGKLDTLRSLLGVDLVDAEMLDRYNILFCDEEWREKNYPIGFKVTYKKRVLHFAGSALITGDDAGKNAPLNLNQSELKILIVRL
jgi:hypothetical protein